MKRAQKSLYLAITNSKILKEYFNSKLIMCTNLSLDRNSLHLMAQSAGAAENTNYMSTEGEDPPTSVLI